VFVDLITKIDNKLFNCS